MATLKCNSCGGAIASGARRVQCPHCAALFPFACAHCGRSLRPPFSESADERYLTHDADPRPLCEEHYLRRCPDCTRWFGAHENPGFFRCSNCAQTHHQKPDDLSANYPLDEPLSDAATRPSAPVEGGIATAMGRGVGFSTNALILVGAACALLALVGWWLFAR